MFASAFMVSFALLGLIGHEDGRQSIDWQTGQALDQQARKAISGHWADAPIRPLLRQLAQHQKTAVFVDRRVDPTIPVTLTAKDLTWDQLLSAIGAEHGLGFCRLENIYYFGPIEDCILLATMYPQLKQQLVKRRDQLQVNWLSPIPVSWSRLSQPRELLQQLADRQQVELLSALDISHDLWEEFDGPNFPPVLQALLLVSGFHKWIAISEKGTRMKVVDYPRQNHGVYVVGLLPDANRIVKELQPQFSNVSFRAVDNSKVEAAGEITNLIPAIDRLIAQQVAIRADTAESRFTFELKGQRGSLLATMAVQLDVKLQYDPELGAILSEYIELNFEDASVDEIITAALGGSGLKFQITETELRVAR